MWAYALDYFKNTSEHRGRLFRHCSYFCFTTAFFLSFLLWKWRGCWEFFEVAACSVVFWVCQVDWPGLDGKHWAQFCCVAYSWLSFFLETFLCSCLHAYFNQNQTLWQRWWQNPWSRPPCLRQRLSKTVNWPSLAASRAFYLRVLSGDVDCSS